MKARGSCLSANVRVLLVIACLGGCGSGDDRADDADNASADAALAAAPSEQGSTCPLTAAEVSDVLGVAVQQDTAICMFEPQPGTEPRVLYVRQVSFACSDAVVNDPSFDLAPYDGLGIRAFASPGGGDLLVCTNPPFEITVDITPSLDDIVADSEAASTAARASERAAAEQLARLVLAR